MSPSPKPKKEFVPSGFEFHKVIKQGNSRLLALSNFLPREWTNIKVRQVDDRDGSIWLEVKHV